MMNAKNYFKMGEEERNYLKDLLEEAKILELGDERTYYPVFGALDKVRVRRYIDYDGASGKTYDVPFVEIFLKDWAKADDFKKIAKYVAQAISELECSGKITANQEFSRGRAKMPSIKFMDDIAPRYALGIGGYMDDSVDVQSNNGIDVLECVWNKLQKNKK